MKGLKTILIKSFFLLAVSLMLGVYSNSYFNLRHINNEILTCTGNIEYSFSSHIDTLNEDQIDQSDNSDLSSEPLSLISAHQTFFPIHIPCFSISSGSLQRFHRIYLQ